MNYMLQPDGSLVIVDTISSVDYSFLHGYTITKTDFQCNPKVINVACANHSKLHYKSFVQQIYERPLRFSYPDYINVYNKLPIYYEHIIRSNRQLYQQGIIPNEDTYLLKYVPKKFFEISGMSIIAELDKSFQIDLLKALVNCYRSFLQFVWRIRDMENVRAAHSYGGEILVSEEHSFSIHYAKNGTNYMQLRLMNIYFEELNGECINFSFKYFRSRDIINYAEKHSTNWIGDDALTIQIPKFKSIKEGKQLVNPVTIFNEILFKYITPFFAANGIEVRIRPNGDFYHCIATFPCNIRGL